MPLSEVSTAVLTERFRLVADMNRDGVFTISDIWAWFNFVFFAPGDLVIGVLYGTAVGRFLEISPGSISGVGSGVLSFFVWMFVWMVVASELESKK
jgi:hypothetical protein